MELTWKIGEKRVGTIWGGRSCKGSVPLQTNFVFEVMGDSGDRGIFDWWVKDEKGGIWGACEEWGSGILDKSIPTEVGQRRMMTVPGVHHYEPVEVLIRMSGSTGTAAASCVSCGDTTHYDKYWGVFADDDRGAIVGQTMDDGVPREGQIRRTKITHIHGDREVTVLVNKVYPGLTAPDLWGFGTCLDCDEPYHKEPGNEWSLHSASVLVTNFQQQPQEQTQQQPEQKETSMELAKRKEWALAQNWDKHVPKTDNQPDNSINPLAGEIYAVGAGSSYRGVAMAVGDGTCVVLGGSIYGYEKGAGRSFPTTSELVKKSRLLVAADSTEVPLAWKKGELRRGPLRASLAADSAVLMENATYKIVARHSGSYDWDVELVSGPQAGTRLGASEQWSSVPVPEMLQPLFLTAYEADPSGEEKAPSKFVKGDVYMARSGYGDSGVAAGDLLIVSRDGVDFYFYGGKKNDTQERVYGRGIYEKTGMYLQLMRPVGSKGKVIPVSEQCGDKSTAYGLTCSMRKNHGGEQHGRGDARWDVAPKVIKLGRCRTGHYDAAGAQVMAVLRVVVDTDGETHELCLPCNADREKRIAKAVADNDKANPQPKYQPRYQVDSMTLDAGGVFRIGG